MITSRVKNATTPYQHTQSHLPQDNKGLFGGKLEGNGMSSIRNYPYFTQVFNLPFPAYHQSRDIIILAKSFPYLEGCAYSRTAVLEGYLWWNPMKTTIQSLSAVQKRGAISRWTSISSNHVSSHLSPLKQHYQPQEAITMLNLHIRDLKSLTGRSLHWPSQLSTSPTPLLTVYL